MPAAPRANRLWHRPGSAASVGRIFIVRHGQSDHNAEGVLQGPRLDGGLSPLGRSQAEAVGRVFADAPLDGIFTSPLQRARDTAQRILAHHRDLALQVVPELYEVDYGDFIGRPLSDVGSDVDQTIDAWRMGFVNQAFPGGESALVAQQRIRPFAERLRAQAEGQSLVVVAHGRINRILIATVLGHGLEAMEASKQPNAGITEVRVEGGGAEVVRQDDTGHLDLSTDPFS